MEEQDFVSSEIKSLGILMDISPLSFFLGYRLADYVKESLIKFIKRKYKDEDIFYLYNTEHTEEDMTGLIGTAKIVAEITKSNPVRILGIRYPWLQTAYVVDSFDFCFSQDVLLITDQEIKQEDVDYFVTNYYKHQLDSQVYLFSFVEQQDINLDNEIVKLTHVKEDNLVELLCQQI